MNAYLDQVKSKLLQYYKQLTSDFELVTSNSIKARFIGQDEKHKTLMDLVVYHNENMAGALRQGTLKNYYTTENYLKRFLVNKKKTKDFETARTQILNKGVAIRNITIISQHKYNENHLKIAEDLRDEKYENCVMIGSADIPENAIPKLLKWKWTLPELEYFKYF